MENAPFVKPVLMIHEVREEFFDLPLQDYVLTFDDGLYSQYCVLDRLLSIPTEKIFFISSGIVCSGPQSREFPPCEIAHTKAFAGNFEDYMTLEQIKHIMSQPMCEIGAHSHKHNRVANVWGIQARYDAIKDDTNDMCDWFEAELGLSCPPFCFPYNETASDLYLAYLKSIGFTRFYGKERTAIETLVVQ